MDEVNSATSTKTVKSDSSETPPVAGVAGFAGTMGDDAQSRLTADQAVEQQKLSSIGASLAVQTDLLKSSHNLLVDIDGKIAKMSDDAVGRAMRPVFIDLVLLYDSLQQARAWVRTAEHLTTEAFEDRLGVLETELLEIMLRRDVRMLEKSGNTLDRQWHRTVKTVATKDPQEDNQICEVIRAGFSVGERVLRPADVVVGRYDATLEREGA